MTAARVLLRSTAPWRVLDGFGRSHFSAARYVQPSSSDELAGVLAQARQEGLRVAFRGSGRSYGDAAQATGQLVVDVRRMNRVVSFDRGNGLADLEAGATIEDLWRTGLPHGWWPSVVPGTMFPTMGGCVAMNIHGKNCFKAGPFGNYVEELDLLTAAGERKTLSRGKEPELFRAVIGGLGLLGAVTRVRMRMHAVESGRLRVRPIRTRTMGEMFDCFEQRMSASDYLVGWVDCFAGGRSLGRGLVHQANYLSAADDPDGRAWLDLKRQDLPPSVMGVPRSVVWRFMRAFSNDPSMRTVNALKYHLPESLGGDGSFVQSHVAFAFLLDYVPNWRNAYGPAGFIQYQVFLPDATARAAMADVLQRCLRRGVVSYLGVFKRHQPDEFLLSHGLDGWSMAMDFPVSARDPRPLQALTQELTELVLDAGGRFYAAKDSVITAAQFARGYGERLERFLALKRQVDPGHLFGSDQSQRLGLDG